MKKICTILLSSAVLLSLTGCLGDWCGCSHTKKKEHHEKTETHKEHNDKKDNSDHKEKSTNVVKHEHDHDHEHTHIHHDTSAKKPTAPAEHKEVKSTPTEHKEVKTTTPEHKEVSHTAAPKHDTTTKTTIKKKSGDNSALDLLSQMKK